MWRTLGNKPLTPLLQDRSAFWVIRTHVGTSLFATIVVLIAGGCLTGFILQDRSSVADIAGFALLFFWLAVAGYAAASHSAHYLRAKAEFPQPTALVTQCTIAYAAVVLTLLVAVAIRNPSWLARVMVPLAGGPCIATFWWQTRSQFREWEQEQAPLKSYGFPVAPVSHTPPIAPAALPIAHQTAPMPGSQPVELNGHIWQRIEQVEVDGRNWHLEVRQDPQTGEFIVQCCELPAAVEQASTAAQAIESGRRAIALALIASAGTE